MARERRQPARRRDQVAVDDTLLVIARFRAKDAVAGGGGGAALGGESQRAGAWLGASGCGRWPPDLAESDA